MFDLELQLPHTETMMLPNVSDHPNSMQVVAAPAAQAYY